MFFETHLNVVNIKRCLKLQLSCGYQPFQCNAYLLEANAINVVRKNAFTMALQHVAVDTFGARSNSFLACILSTSRTCTIPNYKPVAFIRNHSHVNICIGEIISSATTVSSVLNSSDSMKCKRIMVSDEWNANAKSCEYHEIKSWHSFASLVLSSSLCHPL